VAEPERVPVLSLVSPVHDEEDVLDLFLAAVCDALGTIGLRAEIILVDDGSGDASWERIEAAAAHDPRVRGVQLSRSFGKEAAVMAGLAEARGEAVVVLDADLQHPPTLLPDLVARWQEGAEVVEAQKLTRAGQSLRERTTARLFNRIFSQLTGVALDNATDYRLLSRPALDALLAMPERALFFRGTSTWIGFRRETISFEVVERPAGGSRWSARALFRLALNAITSFTAAPLHLVTLAGVVFAVFAAILGAQTLLRWATGSAVPGFTTLILVVLIQGSFVLLGLGVIGEYLARIHDEVKGRPRYLVARRTPPTQDPGPR
jgi:polyisoprenyl-phosphate glycosyltransferase